MTSNTKRGHGEGKPTLDGPAKMKIMDCGAEPGAKQVLRPLRFKCDDTRLHSCMHACALILMHSCGGHGYTYACIYIYIHTHIRFRVFNYISYVRLRASKSPMLSARLLKAGWTCCVMTRRAQLASIYNHEIQQVDIDHSRTAAYATSMARR